MRRLTDTEVQQQMASAILLPGNSHCTHCNGYGSSLKEVEDRCTICGGSGLMHLKK